MAFATRCLVGGCVILALAASAVRADTPAESDAQFFMLLVQKPVATMNDGYQAVAMLAEESAELRPADECHKMLTERGIAHENWTEGGSEPLPKGRLAYMLCQALDIKGGLTMRVFGPSDRYCLFECQYLELMPGGAQYQHVTGGELVSAVDRAEMYRAEQRGHESPEAMAEPVPNRPAEAAQQPVTAEQDDSAGGAPKPAPEAVRPVVRSTPPRGEPRIVEPGVAEVPAMPVE